MQADPLSPWELAAVLASFLLATLILTLPVALHPASTLPSDLVDTLLNTWILGWDADRLAHGLHGVWEAPIFFPYHDALAFSENLFGLGFLVAPVYWVSRNPVLTYNIAFLFSFVVAGAGMYLLVRSLTRSRSAAAVAGAAYAFCPFRLAQIAHIQMVATGWMPIALWALHEYVPARRRRWLVVFAVAAVLQALSNMYVGYFMAVPILIVASDLLMRERVRRLRAVLDVAAACLAIAVVLAPVGAAYYRARSQYTQVRRPDEIVNGGADVRSYLVGKNSIGMWRWLPTAVASDPEKELFPGVFAVLLGAAAFWPRAGREGPPGRWVRLYGWIALAGFVCSLGPQVKVWGLVVTDAGPYGWLLRIVPGMDGMRVPARFAIVFVLGLSVLAGCGVLAVLSRLPRRLRPLALAVCLMAIVADSWAAPLPTYPYAARGRAEDRAAATWLRNQPSGAVLHLPIKPAGFQYVNYQYATLFHGHPIVNGFSGYDMPLQELLRGAMAPAADDQQFRETVGRLPSIGVRYVIAHPGDFDTPSQSAWTLAALRRSPQIVRETTLVGVSAFELAP